MQVEGKEIEMEINTENNLKIEEKSESKQLKSYAIKPEGMKITYEGQDYISCRTDNIHHIILNHGEDEFYYLLFPQDSENHIFVKLGDNFQYTMSSNQIEKLRTYIDSEEVNWLFEHINQHINEDHELEGMTGRAKAMSCMGWCTFIFLMVSSLGIFAAGVYSQVNRERGTDTGNGFFNCTTPGFFLTTVCLILMAIYILLSCITNKKLREYQLQKFKVKLYKERIERILINFNKKLQKTGSEVRVDMVKNLAYVHFCLDPRETLEIPSIYDS
jgi:hypothetical protein